MTVYESFSFIQIGSLSAQQVLQTFLFKRESSFGHISYFFDIFLWTNIMESNGIEAEATYHSALD